MSSLPHPVSLTFGGATHRGCYRLSNGELIVEAFGVGRKSLDASILKGEMGMPARNMALLILHEQIRECATTILYRSLLELAGSEPIVDP